MRIRVMGRFWQLVRLPQLRHHWGYCDPPDRPGKRIAVSTRATGLTELDVYIHEILHAGFPDLKEESVDEFSTDLARVLWRLGYRRQDDV